MFKSIITATPFTSDVANDFFQNIYGDSFHRDISFLATLRALVAPRMKKSDYLHLKFRSSSYSTEQLKNTEIASAIQAVSALGDDIHEELIIHNFINPSQDNNYAWMELMKASFCEVYKGWNPLEKVTDLFRPIFYVLCFVNPESNSTIIFTDNMDIRKMHALQAAIPGFVPWYFNPDNAGINGEEKELLDALFKYKTSQHYEDCLARMAEKYDFKTAKIRQLLAGFETRYEMVERDKARAQIQDAISHIESYNRAISEYLRQKRDLEIKILGLETAIGQDGGDSEIMEYFLCNDRLVLESVNNTKMVFGVRDYITYFDEDMARKVINNEASYIYRSGGRVYNNIIPADDMKKLFTAIFLDETLRIRVCAAYEFRLDSNVRAISNYSYGSEYRDYTPNTHIDRYSCLGSYEIQINKLLANRDYIGAIEQCVASCKSLNFGDSTVMTEFMRRLYGISDYTVNVRCIELPDGRVVTPKEAIKYLKQEEVANG